MATFSETLQHGQSLWLDNISRQLIASGELQRLVGQGLRGVTSNPAIFEKAIASSTDYDSLIQALISVGITTEQEIYEALAIRDIQDAADILLPVYQSSEALDGYVSLEVNPTLAEDVQGTLAEARHLYRRVNRPNVMIKIPATAAGIHALPMLIAEGISINMTLMFSIRHYEAVVEAYLQGLEERAKSGSMLSAVASVASVFVSRIDSKLDPQLSVQGLPDLAGTLAIANSKQIYQRFKQLFQGARWNDLLAKGAQVQRPLWASTSTKNLAYPDVLYMETLIGAQTVNTAPTQALNAFLDHGVASATLETELQLAQDQVAKAQRAGVDLDAVGEILQQEGARQFNEAFSNLLDSIQLKIQRLTTV